MQLKIIKILIICLLCTGCSTLITLDKRSNKYYPYTEMTNECKIYEQYGIKQQPVYSGSRNALSYIVYPGNCGECGGLIYFPVMLPYFLIDLPFSFIADTFALPYTYNLQFKTCPNVDWPELSKRRNLLADRIRLYYSDYSNPEHIWVLSSSNFKGKLSRAEFIKYIRENNFMIGHGSGNFVTEIMTINKDKARVLMNDGPNYAIPPWYDFWVYEGANWYIDQPNRKTEFTLLLEKQGPQR